MFSGMMWFDDDPKASLEQKVQKAAEYFRAKYGHSPDLCLVNPGMLAEPQRQAGRVTIRPLKAVLPGHLWIGKQEGLPTGAD